MAHTVDRLFHTFKDIFDALESVPGIAAFIKVFFGSEEAEKKMKERLFTDVRDEVLEDVRMLGLGRRENLVRRLHEAELRGEEDDLVWDFGKIKKEVRRDTLEWFNSLDDQDFKVYVDLLHDNKFRQFARRALLFFHEEAAPVMNRAVSTTISTIRAGVAEVDDWADTTAAPAVHRFGQWLKKKGVRR